MVFWDVMLYSSECFEGGGGSRFVDCVWNVMAHAQKPDFDFRRNGLGHLNWRGRQFSRPLAAEVWASAVVMLDTPCSEVVWRVLATHSVRQFPLSLPLLCVTVCHYISTGLYKILFPHTHWCCILADGRVVFITLATWDCTWNKIEEAHFMLMTQCF